MRKTIYLIRHGQARAGTSNYDRLSALGEQQASLLGQHMLDNACLPEEIWSGTLLRQQQSAQHFLQASRLTLPIQTDPRLNEYDHRVVHHLFHPDNQLVESAAQVKATNIQSDEDLPISMPFDTYSSIILNWANHRPSNQDSNFESWAEFKSRSLNAMLEIARSSNASTIALFTSGGVISVIAAQLENREDQRIPSLIWDLNNASVNTVKVSDSDATVLSINDVQHLTIHSEEELVTKI